MTDDERQQAAEFEETSSPPMHPSKYPGTDRAAILPGVGRSPRVSLDEAIRSADREAISAAAAAAEAERLEVVARFPLADWPSIPLERYALGTPTAADSFCRWMEFNTPHMASMRGGSALKHLIFKRGGDNTDWYFEKKYQTLDEAWRSVRAGFVEAFRLGAEGRFDEVGQVEAIGAAVALTTKAVYTYFPEILPVCSGAHQEHFWQVLGGTGPITRGVPAARRLLGLAHEGGRFDGWTPDEIMEFLYRWADPRQGSRIVKIAPGRGAELWQDCLANGYIRVGWDGTGYRGSAVLRSTRGDLAG